jgi:hypothetical protein
LIALSWKPLDEFVKRRVREILGKHGEMIQAPYFSFIRKIQSKRIKTYADLENVIKDYVSQGLKEEALKEIVPLVRSDLWTKRK